MISCLSDDAKNLNKQLGKSELSVCSRTYFINLNVCSNMNISAEMLTRDPRVLPQEAIDAARRHHKRQPWEI